MYLYIQEWRNRGEEEEGSTIAAWGNTPREWCPTLS